MSNKTNTVKKPIKALFLKIKAKTVQYNITTLQHYNITTLLEFNLLQLGDSIDRIQVRLDAGHRRPSASNRPNVIILDIRVFQQDILKIIYLFAIFKNVARFLKRWLR